MAIEVDVADEQSNIDMVDKILAQYGRLDAINNAAIFSRITVAPFWELPVDEWKRAVDVNVNGAFLCSRAAVHPMIEAKWGRIINVSSGTMMMGRPNYLHYITTKAAMIGMSRSMAREVEPYGITVNTFWPGVMQTEVERPSVPREMFKTMTAARKRCCVRARSMIWRKQRCSLLRRSCVYHGPRDDRGWRTKLYLTPSSAATGRHITKKPDSGPRATTLIRRWIPSIEKSVQTTRWRQILDAGPGGYDRDPAAWLAGSRGRRVPRCDRPVCWRVRICRRMRISTPSLHATRICRCHDVI